MRDARIRTKLALVLFVPVAAVIALAALRLVDIDRGARDATLLRSLVALSADISAVNYELHNERMAAAELLATPGSSAGAYDAAVARADREIATYSADRGKIGGAPSGVAPRLDRIDEQLATLGGVRKRVSEREQHPASEALLRYGAILSDLMAYGDVLGQFVGEGQLADEVRAVTAFGRAKAATAEEASVAYAALAPGRPLTEEEFASFTATLTGQAAAQEAFDLVASEDQKALVNAVVTGDAVTLADLTATLIARSARQPALISPAAAARSINAVADLMRYAEVELETRLLTSADAARVAVVRQAFAEAVIVSITLIVALALAAALARSLSRSLRRLRDGALAVANHGLPGVVAQLRDVRSLGEGGPDEVVRQVRDVIRLRSRDEVGEVAKAFNVVHREAVRIAAEQAALRTSVSAMFLNLARRSQTLVDRMISELDTIERGEEDPKRLSQLFRLDHLATRMRRNDENLLVLAGADSGPSRVENALLVDVLRAAQAEIEFYNRIEFSTIDAGVAIAARAVNDVVRLVAELLDNATRFSPPTAVVVAAGRLLGDYAIIQVEDRGVGIPPDRLAVINQRLAHEPDVDVAAFRLMGFAVVGRLAARHGIRVELSDGTEGGVVAQVLLPPSILVLPRRVHGTSLSHMRSAASWQPGGAATPQAQWPVALQSTQSAQSTLQAPWHPAVPLDVGSAGHQPVDAYRAGALAEETAEIPIFREMDAGWFQSHGQTLTETMIDRGRMSGIDGVPAASPTTEPRLAAANGAPASPHRGTWSAPSGPTEGIRPSSGRSAGRVWRTAADEGWERAEAAARPERDGTTRSGLPIRSPKAQLVPGTVETTQRPMQRRNPDEVRGLLAAYQQGVQQGRANGARRYGNTPDKEYSE